MAENYGYSVLQIVNVEVRPLDVGVQIFDESDGREVFNELMRLGSDGDTAQIPLPCVCTLWIQSSITVRVTKGRAPS